jgi:PPOX class probable F420-dependent enzyme
MARPMTDDERQAFLLSGTRTAVLATTYADGRPHAVPVGFVLDEDDVLFLTNGGTAKSRNLQRDPRVTLLVQDETPPYAFVMIEGTAEASTESSQARQSATIGIGRRYAGAEHVDEFVAYAKESLDLFVRVRPNRILALDRVAEE